MSQDIIEKAIQYCEKNKLRLTYPRKQVLSIIASSNKPMGAYEVLAALGQKLNKPKPPTAYRAIEFWQKHGFIHRIESLNAYTACKAGHHHQGSQFMICNDCGHVTEAHLCDIPQPLKDNIENGAFQASHWNLEVHGVCAKCV